MLDKLEPIRSQFVLFKSFTIYCQSFRHTKYKQTGPHCQVQLDRYSHKAGTTGNWFGECDQSDCEPGAQKQTGDTRN